ncbi:MAG: DUF4340 domain-containing protein, partial [Caldilineaceae bacterium]|nr:DUF4340 domain-containing protein [Caldilineaceae bacterium]
QLVLIAVVFWPGRGANATAAALFPDVTVDDVQAMTIQEGEKQIQVARSGDGWVLPDAGDFPVKAVTVSDTISKVLQIDTRRLVADDTSSHARLQVTEEDAQREVTLETTAGETLTLLVGSSPSFRSTNVRRNDSDAVYTTGSLQATDLRTDYANWIDTSYLAIPQTDIQALTVENAQGTLSFTEVSTDTWTLDDLAEGETFNQNNLTSLLTRFSGLNMVQPLGKEAQPAYGMENPAATVTIVHQPTGGTAETTTLTIGTEPLENGNYVVKSSDSAYYVEVASFSVENILNRGRADYLQQPEEDAAGIDGTESITATEFISGFGAVTATTPISGGTPVTATEAVTP